MNQNVLISNLGRDALAGNARGPGEGNRDATAGTASGVNQILNMTSKSLSTIQGENPFGSGQW